jgi:hypothetical protein
VHWAWVGTLENSVGSLDPVLRFRSLPLYVLRLRLAYLGPLITTFVMLHLLFCLLVVVLCCPREVSPFWRRDKPTDVKGAISYAILPINQPPIQDSEKKCFFTFRCSFCSYLLLNPKMSRLLQFLAPEWSPPADPTTSMKGNYCCNSLPVGNYTQ